MKKMKASKYILIIMACLWVLSCTKVTDQVPESIITGTNFYKTASDADNAINACYDALQGSPANYEMWGDGRTDIFASTDRSSSSDLQIVSGNVSSSGDYVSWNSLYTGINRCNSVLKNVPGMTDPALAARKDRILGEAYFLRALFYFYLARTYETEPLILQPYEDLSGDFFPKNSDRATVFTQVEADLKEAEKRVPDVPFSTTLENKGKASSGAIHSAMADLYLWQKKYQAAADAANLAINSTAKYTLVAGSSFATIFTSKNTTESILEVEYSYTYLEGNNNNLTDIFLPLGGSYTAGNWRVQPPPVVLAALPASDLRSSATYKNTGAVPAPYRDANKTYVVKYPGTLSGNVLYQDANRIVYRLAEIILFRAEALNELGQTPAAITLLNQVRTRAGLAGTAAVSQADVRLAIENERLAELAYEGKRYYDLIRTGRYVAVTGFTNPDWQRWPIPASEITRNPNLVQNHGY
jgi:tetratricopeptide (TPR) repeat protein